MGISAEYVDGGSAIKNKWNLQISMHESNAIIILFLFVFHFLPLSKIL